MQQVRRVLITGGSQGIGFQVAKQLAKTRDPLLVVLTSRSEDKLAAARKSLEKERSGEGFKVATRVMDVGDPASIEAVMSSVQNEFGSIQQLVLSAGVADSAPLPATTDEQYERLMSVNAGGVFRTIRAALPAMLEQAYGRIVVLGSVASKSGGPYISAYCASKHAVLGMIRALALEVANRGVTANLVCPGYVDTPMTESAVARISKKTGMAGRQAREAIAKRSPQRRIFSAEEVAAAVCFLLSDEAKGVNGSTIDVDGGELAG